jgi:hypothetical protein
MEKEKSVVSKIRRIKNEQRRPRLPDISSCLRCDSWQENRFYWVEYMSHIFVGEVLGRHFNLRGIGQLSATYQISWSGGWHYWFIFWRPRVQTSTARLPAMTDTLMAFLAVARQCSYVKSWTWKMAIVTSRFLVVFLRQIPQIMTYLLPSKSCLLHWTIPSSRNVW